MATGDESLTGRVAVVTGAGRGLGRAHALALAERGAAVVVNDTGGALDGSGADAGVAQAVVDEIVSAGGRAVADTTDVSSFGGGTDLVAHALDAFGHLDVVVNNAGVSQLTALVDLEEAELRRFLDVHVVGTVGVTRAAFDVMTDGGRVIVTTSGTAVDVSGPGLAAYATAKAALLGFVRAAALEGAPRAITVNAIAPLAYTRMSAEFFGGDQADRLRPEAVARVVAWLASDAAADVTGQVLRIGGDEVRTLRTVAGPAVTLGPDDASVAPALRAALTDPGPPRPTTP